MFQSFDAPAPAEAPKVRLARVRALMEAAGIDALLVPRADEHQNEYVPACAERLAWLTGFTGSAGLAVVARKSAALFVDGRYTVQAPREVDTSLYDIKGIRTTDLMPWLAKALKSGAVLGFDARLHTVGEIEKLKTDCAGHGIELKPLSKNVVDAAWGSDRPAAPSAPALVHPLAFAGKAAADKVAEVQKSLRAAGEDALVLSTPDSICWLFNIRGTDIAHNPLVLAYAIVAATGKPELFIEPAKITPEVKAHLTGVARLRPPKDLRSALAALKAAKRTVRIPPATSWWTYLVLGGAKRVRRAADPCVDLKAIKNPVEIAGARSAHVRDGMAMARFLAWFDAHAAAGKLDEISAVKKLEACRRETDALREISFPTISSSGPNGAIVHYRVTEATNRRIGKGELFLLDSGGQYSDGTTDITRTLAVGEPSQEMRERFTLVLKGMIAISRARFPRGTRGIDLDPLARRALWAAGLNYDHGTGHGVGSFLPVHEGPQSISKAGMAELKPGMICSNEPGYYKSGAYGIRIENLILVTEPEDVGGDAPVLGFETLTLVPIDRRLVAPALLDADERAWLDAYHRRVHDTLAPHLDPEARAWIKSATDKV